MRLGQITLLEISLSLAILGLVALVAITARQRRWRDPNRFFSWQDKQLLRTQAGNRCEHKPPLWHRCQGPAEEADHVIPWSRGGLTHVGNGQYLCRKHNQRKSSRMPSALYRWRLHRRRRRYAPPSRTSIARTDQKDLRS